MIPPGRIGKMDEVINIFLTVYNMEEVLEMLKKTRHPSDMILKVNISSAFSNCFILVCFFKIIHRNII